MESICCAIAVFALWFLFRPYIGLIHDSTIYIGRAVADLHPQTIGQQLSYVHDGQSKFSVFPSICADLVRSLGPGPAAMLLTAGGLFLWILAAGFLFSRFLSGRLVWAALSCLCVVPPQYGGRAVFQWAEPFATPRIFSEAASLVAIAMFFDRRPVIAGIFSALAFVIHPIMALPAIALMLLELCERDARWIVACAFALIAFVVGAFAGLPFADRLLTVPDPLWLQTITQTSSPVVLSSWMPPDFGLLACQFGTVVLITLCDQGKFGRLAARIALVALAGLVATIAVPTLLVMQMQPWRALWLLSVIAAGGLPLVAWRLWGLGREGHTALALLLIAWTENRTLWISLPCVVAAVAFAFLRPRNRVPRWIPIFGWSSLASIVMIHAAFVFKVVSGLQNPLPEGIYGTSADSIGFGLQTPLLVGLAIAAMFFSLPRFSQRTLIAIAGVELAIGLVSLAHWDRRSQFERALESGVGAESLQSKIKSGSVFWVGRDLLSGLGIQNAAWLWTARPNWWDARQGAGVVFDRQLAMEWRRRLDLLEFAGLAPWKLYSKGGKWQVQYIVPVVDGASLKAVCVAGGPDWLVAPREQTTPSADRVADGAWRAPTPAYAWAADFSRIVVQRDFLIFDCARIRDARG